MKSAMLVKKEAGIMKQMLAMALPMVISFACETVMIFTDRMFLSRLSPVMMNATLAGGLSAFMLMTFFVGLIGYSTALVAQYLGAGQKSFCRIVTSQALLVALVAYPIILALRPLVFYLFEHMGITQEQLGPQKIYFNILVFGSVLPLFRNTLSNFFSGIGRTRVVMVASLTAMTVNVGASYLLIFGKGPFPTMGIAGAGYGSLIGSVSAVAVLLQAYLSSQTRAEFSTGLVFKFHRVVMKKLLRFGYPAGIEMALNILAFNTMVMLFQSVDLVGATAATIVFTWDMVSFIPLLGVEIGVTSLVGRFMGARDPASAEIATSAGLKLAFVFSGVVFILYLGVPELLVFFFEPDQPDPVFFHAIPMGIVMLRTTALYVLLEAVLVVYSGALRGAGDTLWAMCYSVSVHWVLLAVAFIMLRLFQITMPLAWLAVILTFLFLSGIIYLRYQGRRWQKIQVLG